MGISNRTQKRIDRDLIKSAERSDVEVVVDQKVKRPRKIRSIFSSNSDDELKNDENHENHGNQTTHSPISSIRTSDKKIESSRNVFQILDKNVPIQRSPKPKPIRKSNSNDAFDMIAAGPTFEKGRLIRNSNSCQTINVISYSSKRSKLSSHDSDVE